MRIRATKAVSKRILELAAKAGERGIKEEMLLKEAESKDSVLHPYFLWDDRKAGHLYRLEQARSLIGSVMIVSNGERTRAFAYVPSKEAFLATEKVAASTNLLAEVVASMTRDIELAVAARERFLAFAPVKVQAQFARFQTTTKVGLAKLAKTAARVTTAAPPGQ